MDIKDKTEKDKQKREQNQRMEEAKGEWSMVGTV